MFVQASIILSSLFATALGHMGMCDPVPRYSNYNGNSFPPPAGQTYDYNIKSPIGTSEVINDPICKHTVPYDSPVATWTAGQTVPVSFQANGAAHSGGHCQFSLSYDGGKTFVVIHDVLRNCFFNSPTEGNNADVLNYQIPLPAQLPSGRAVFSWSWVNASGNREYYQNCADVEIKGNAQSFSGPQMLIVNYGPSYPVIPEFGGNYDTGLDLFQARPTITVSGNGGYSTVSNEPSTNVALSAVETNDATDVSAGSPEVVSSISTLEAANDDSDTCVFNASRCCSVTNGFQVCSNGAWVTIDCPATTVCKMDNGFPQCTWP